MVTQGLEAKAQPNGTDTLTTTVVTNEQWQQSTVVDYKTADSFPWTGIYAFPPDSSFIRFPVLDQPYGYVTISTIPGSSVIKSEDGVRFYRTYFNVDSLAVITKCRLRIFVDDDIAIYINKNLVAKETTGAPSNYKGAPHDLVLYNFGPHINGYNGGDLFDYVTPSQTIAFFMEGRNELLIGVRNKKNDLGGFSFRMDYDYVVNPEWVGLPNDNTLESSLAVFPNPSTGWINITGNDNMGPAEISLYNEIGMKVHQSEVSNFPHSVDLNSLPTGIYYLMVKNSRFSYSKKLLRQ